MADRFYLAGPWQERVELDGPEGHHLSRVLRAEPGDLVELFDGQGRTVSAVVEQVGKKTVSLCLTSAVRESNELQPELILAVASPKGDRLSWMIEKVTELGVDRIIPISTSRGVVKPSDQKLLKAEQTVLAACKQSRRDRFLVVDPVCRLENLMERIDAQHSQLFLGAPEAGTSLFPSSEDLSPIRQLVAVIGPEGGLTPEENLLLTTWGVRPISLSPNVLRIETAAVAFAAWLTAGRMLRSSR